ncbi:MAG TPA: hypothetical protein VIL27_06200, partial [Clostridia bacterium]
NAVKFLNKLYADGLMDVEGFTLTTAQYQAKLNLEPGIVGYTQVWDFNDIISNPTTKAAMVYMPLLTDPSAAKPVFYSQPLPGVYRGWDTITKACKTPEVAIRWIDYFFDATNSIEHIEGPIGVRVLKNADGTLYVRPAPAGKTVAEDRFANCNAQTLAMMPSLYTDAKKLPGTLGLPSTDAKVAAVVKYCTPFSDPDPMMPVYYTDAEATDMLTLQVDIRAYIERKMSEWIMNGKIDSEWDAYITEIGKAGLPKWLSINQAAYDRFIK